MRCRWSPSRRTTRCSKSSSRTCRKCARAAASCTFSPMPTAISRPRKACTWCGCRSTTARCRRSCTSYRCSCSPTTRRSRAAPTSTSRAISPSPSRLSKEAAPGARSVLKEVFGYAAFRGPQEEIVRHVASGGDCLVLMPTGGGKSLCYQIPALLRPGTGIVVSPLIALMQDQVAALREAGVRAAFLNSSLSAAAAGAVERGLLAGDYDLLYVAPERLLMPRFLEQIGRLYASARLALF